MEIIIFVLSMIFISLAVSSISYTISKTDIFESIRKKISKHSNWLGKLISCPYCLSHWISFVIILFIYRTFNLEVFVLTFAIVTLSAIWTGKISRSFDFMV